MPSLQCCKKVGVGLQVRERVVERDDRIEGCHVAWDCEAHVTHRDIQRRAQSLGLYFRALDEGRAKVAGDNSMSQECKADGLRAHTAGHIENAL